MPSPPQVIRREDYRPPAYRVEEVHLHFDLGEERTRVASRLTLKRPEEAGAEDPLVLFGSGLALLRLNLDGRELQPGEYTTLIVSDSGDGIDEKVLPHIFEPFFTTKSKDKGTGLGLATVYGIVQQNNGQVQVYTEEGFGTTFKLYFPVADMAETAEPDPVPTPASASGGTETVLLVDDDPKIRDIVGEGLRRHGYHVLDAVDGEDALRLARQYVGAVDLLVTDMVMPAVDGGALAQELQQKWPALKTLYISGYTHNVLAYRGYFQNENVNFVEKPFNLNRLLSTVRTLLDRE